MSVNSTLPPPLSLPNPYTPLAWVDPRLAGQIAAAQYVFVISCSAFIWDWLVSMPQEYKMLIRQPWSLATALYVVSRLGTATYLVTSTLFQISPVKNCDILLKVVTSSFTFAITPTAFLFFLRVRAVYHKDRLVVGMFGFLWLAVLGTSLVVPLGAAEGIHIGTTNQCTLTKISSIAIAPVVATMVLNLLVCVAVTWRLAVIHQSTRSRFWTFFRGEGTSPLASMLIKSGQLYYLVTLGFNIVVGIMFVAPGVPAILRPILTAPHLALENSMATRVFRMLKFDAQSSALTIAPLGSGSRRPEGHTSRSQEETGNGHGMIVFRNQPHIGVGVEVSTHVYAEEDGSAKPADLSV